MLTRRTFLSTLSAGLLAAPLAADAQPGTVTTAKKAIRIGVLYPGADNDIFRT